MKYVTSLIILMAVMATVCFADVVVEKVDNNTVKVTETKQIVTEQTKSLEQLQQEVIQKDEQIAHNLSRYENEDARLKAEKVVLEQQVVDAQALGVKTQVELIKVVNR